MCGLMTSLDSGLEFIQVVVFLLTLQLFIKSTDGTQDMVDSKESLDHRKMYDTLYSI